MLARDRNFPLFVEPMRAAASTFALALVLQCHVARAAPPGVGDLSGDDCSHVEEPSGREVMGYWRRYQLADGGRRREKLLAGGDGTCVLGFPASEDGRGLVFVDGRKVPVHKTRPAAVGAEAYVSRDGAVRVAVRPTGTKSTCMPDVDKCCGDYTFVTIRITVLGRGTTAVKAVTYEGG